MLRINIEKGKELLCIRFVDVGGFECIKEHLRYINEYGYVWFGKIGNKPTTKVLNKMLEAGSNYILLKDPKKAYICQFESYSESTPSIAEYPDYYNTEILPGRNFSIWFKLISIIEVDNLNKLNDVVLKSSRSPILETVRRSMASHFYTVARKDIEF